jgi:LuxR family maltose regulon positive regulatory protein
LRLLDVAEAARAAQPAEVRELYPSLHLHAGLLQLVGGDFTSGLRSLWRAYERAGDNPRVYIQSDAASKTALAYAVLGDHRRAAVWLDRHTRAPLDAGYLERRIRCTAIAARLLIAVDQLDAASADAAYSDILTADTNPEELFWAYLGYAEAQYALLTGAAGDMLDHLDQVRSHYEHWLGNGSIAGPLLAATSADLLLALGRGNHAQMITNGPLADHPLLRVSQARLALLAGQTDAALRLATDSSWHGIASSRHRIEMRLIHAVAAHRAGDHSTALVALRQAVDAAHLVGTLRPFASVPADDLHSIAADLPAAAELLDTPALKSARAVYPTQINLIELTKREQQVLDRLAAGLSVQQIANSLRISYNTVKVQQRSLYRKLEVTSRDDAAARGREHGLVTSPPPTPA